MTGFEIAAIIGAGTALLGALGVGQDDPKIAPASATPLGNQGQGIASIDIEDIGEDTEKVGEDIQLEEGLAFNANKQDDGILSALQNKLGAKAGRPINSFEDMSLEELLAVLSMDELTDVGPDFTIDDVMNVVTPKTAKPNPAIDTNLISLLETPEPDVIDRLVQAEMNASMPSSNKTETANATNATKEAMAAAPSEPMTGQEIAGIITAIAQVAQFLDDDDDRPLSPASAPSFSYRAPSGGITLENIGMNMGGATSKVLARPMFKGNPVVGPGGPKDDIIPVLASDGEFMLSKAAVDHAGGGNHALGIERLKAFNNKGNQRYG